MKAELVSIGTELLLGQITDTNASYLAGELPSLGIDLYFISQVGDNLGRLVDTLRRGWQRSDLIVTTGGLGPTEDDVTREAIAALMGEEMIVQPALEADLRAYFQRRGRPMTTNNLKQATLIASASALPNPVGSAPGWWVEKDGHIIVSMPGVPREMYRMWQNEAAPRLKTHERTGEAIIVSRTVKLLGIGESLAEDKIRHLLASTNPTIGTYAKQDGIHLRLTSKAATEALARAAITPMEKTLRDILGSYIYGYDADTPPTVVGDLLIAQGKTLAIMETCSGGHVASTLMDDVRFARFFRGGIVAPTEAALIDYGLPEALLCQNGLYSMEVAAAMARAVRERLWASMGLGVTGSIAGDAAAGVGAGTINIALDDGELRTSSMTFPTIAAEIKRWAMLNALNLVKLRLLGEA